MGDKSELICIHGTFAGEKHRTDKNRKKVWWHQRESPFRLNLLTPELAEKVSQALPVDWGGDNLESARTLGAEKLLAKLFEMEDQDASYHLIGHSHGGSVIWKTLCMAESRNWRRRFKAEKGSPALKGVRSWTTLGTPFIHFKNNVVAGIPGFLYITFFLILTILLADQLVSYLLPGDAPGIIAGLEGRANDGGLLAFLHKWLPFSAAIDPILVIVGYALLLSLLVSTFRTIIENLTRGPSLYRAQQYYLCKWLGITSEDDEAVNGLKHSLELKQTLIKPVSLVATQFAGNTIRWIRSLAFLGPRILYNAFLVPIGNRFMRTQLKSVALGDDLPFLVPHSVATSPVKGCDIDPLPERIDREILRSANRALERSIPSLRDALKRGMTAAGSNGDDDLHLDFAADVFSGQELVHTSYFNNASVNRLILDNIRRGEEVDTGFSNKDWMDKQQEKLEARKPASFALWPMMFAIGYLLFLVWWNSFE